MKDWIVSLLSKMFGANVLGKLIGSITRRVLAVVSVWLIGQQVDPQLVSDFINNAEAIMLMLSGGVVSIVLSWIEKATRD